MVFENLKMHLNLALLIIKSTFLLHYSQQKKVLVNMIK
jgi:hypothetical protein